MRYRKIYGRSKEEGCVICGKTATAENAQGLPVCRDHKGSTIDDKRCVCGEYLEVKKSKFGAFFVCKNCGPISLSKAQDLEEGSFKLNKRFRSQEPKEKIYTLDELKRLWD